MDRNDTRFYDELDFYEQLIVARALMSAGIEGEDFDRAVTSRVCDLADTVEIWE